MNTLTSRSVLRTANELFMVDTEIFMCFVVKPHGRITFAFYKGNAQVTRTFVHYEAFVTKVLQNLYYRDLEETISSLTVNTGRNRHFFHILMRNSNGI